MPTKGESIERRRHSRHKSWPGTLIVLFFNTCLPKMDKKREGNAEWATAKCGKRGAVLRSPRQIKREREVEEDSVSDYSYGEVVRRPAG